MAANKAVRFGPVSLTTSTTTNILNPPTLTGGTGLAGTNSATYLIIRHVRVVNTTTGSLSFATWLGTTGINTQAAAFDWGGIASTGTLTNGVTIAAGSYVDWYGYLRMDTADYLVGGASAAGLTLTGEGEIGIV
jgi:hypothetical protein